MFQLTNQNSCGQGQSELVKSHPLAPIVESWDYKYSHSTPITLMGGEKILAHTFLRPGFNRRINKADTHTVTVFDHNKAPLFSWETGILGSGRKTVGINLPATKSSLARHLAGKARRYGI